MQLQQTHKNVVNVYTYDVKILITIIHRFLSLSRKIKALRYEAYNKKVPIMSQRAVDHFEGNISQV